MGNAALTSSRARSHPAGISSYLLAGIWGLEMAHLFSPLPELRRAGSVALVLFIGLALVRASRHIRVLCIALTAMSALLAALFHHWDAIPRGIESAVIFGAFLPTVLLMRATAEESPHAVSIREQLTAMNSTQRAGWVLLSTHVLGAILNVGAMAILSPMMPRNLSERQRREIAESSVRGLGLAVMWSPFFVASAVASQLVPTVKLWQSIPVALAIAVVGFVISYLMFSRNLGWRSARALLGATGSLVTPVLVTVLLVIAVTALTPLRGLQAVILIIPPLCFVFLWARGDGRVKTVAVRTFGSLGRLSDEIIIVTTAMTLGAVISGTPAIAGFLQQFHLLVRSAGIIIGAEVLLMVAAGYCGLHPMIPASILIPLTRSLNPGIADLVMMQTVVVAWALSATVSIFTLPVVAGATMFGVPVRHLAFGNNLKFVIVYGVCAVAALTGLNYMLAG